MGGYPHHDGVRQLGEKVRLVLVHVVNIHDLAELVYGLEIEVLPPQLEDSVAEELFGGESVRERPVAPREASRRQQRLSWRAKRVGPVDAEFGFNDHYLQITGAACSSFVWGGAIIHH